MKKPQKIRSKERQRWGGQWKKYDSGKADELEKEGKEKCSCKRRSRSIRYPRAAVLAVYSDKRDTTGERKGFERMRKKRGFDGFQGREKKSARISRRKPGRLRWQEGERGGTKGRRGEPSELFENDLPLSRVRQKETLIEPNIRSLARKKTLSKRYYWGKGKR